ncbi:MAG: hypothetical protein A2163_08020 [Actinobacteria bacterium RBG_13_35_12]|nr:MAG: hypothetical protein A2163_08020 [Actinobacteria bacterium RBG_13_35_12]
MNEEIKEIDNKLTDILKKDTFKKLFECLDGFTQEELHIMDRLLNQRVSKETIDSERIRLKFLQAFVKLSRSTKGVNK